MKKFVHAVIFFGVLLAVPPFASAEEAVPQAPEIFLNGKPGNVTVQDLSGFGTRPLRLLVERNNRVRGEGFIGVYALGVRKGDELAAELVIPLPGTRATVYKIAREEDGHRYVSMPFSVYFPEAGAGRYQQRIESPDEEFLVAVFERTDSPDEKNIQVRYFEERVRKLAVSFKTNLMFSALKMKMKDLAADEAEKFFERDAQLLIDRLKAPQRILLIRLWRKK